MSHPQNKSDTSQVHPEYISKNPILNSPVVSTPPAYSPYPANQVVQNHHQGNQTQVPVPAMAPYHQQQHHQQQQHQYPPQNPQNAGQVGPYHNQSTAGYPPQNFGYPPAKGAPGPFPMMPSSDVTQCSDPTLTTCPNCKSYGMTRVQRSFGTCQLITGILLFGPIGISILVLGRNYDHYRGRCNLKIGTKEGFCC